LFAIERSLEKKIFESSLEAIIQEVKGSISENYLEYSDIDRLFNKLELGIPINEIEDAPVATAKILFTGWIYFFKINEKYEGEEYMLNHQTLMRLLLKSLHSSYVHQEYKKSEK
jgi:hypothetical protein